MNESFGVLKGKNNFAACDASLKGLTKTSDKFENDVKLHRIQVSSKIDFAKYPVVIQLSRA